MPTFVIKLSCLSSHFDGHALYGYSKHLRCERDVGSDHKVVGGLLLHDFVVCDIKPCGHLHCPDLGGWRNTQ